MKRKTLWPQNTWRKQAAGASTTTVIQCAKRILKWQPLAFNKKVFFFRIGKHLSLTYFHLSLTVQRNSSNPVLHYCFLVCICTLVCGFTTVLTVTCPLCLISVTFWVTGLLFYSKHKEMLQTHCLWWSSEWHTCDTIRLVRIENITNITLMVKQVTNRFFYS